MFHNMETQLAVPQRAGSRLATCRFLYAYAHKYSKLTLYAPRSLSFQVRDLIFLHSHINLLFLRSTCEISVSPLITMFDKMSSRVAMAVWCLSLMAAMALAQQQCYYGPGAQNRGDSNLVPCNSTGSSACCLQGDTCLSGNACYNFDSGNVYQYGCTDIDYNDKTCPYKCGFDPGKLHTNTFQFEQYLTGSREVTMDSDGVLQRCSRSFQHLDLPRSRKLRLRVELNQVAFDPSA